MKIGIITFHDSINYGASLQAYALQKYLNRSNSCEIIDYRCEAISADTKVQKLKEAHGFKGMIKKIISLKYYEKKRDNFREFLKKCNVSDVKYTRDTIKDANHNYDIFITGSDQVFNLDLTHDDYSYYLDFVDSKKIKMSYAASLGAYRYSSNDDKSKKLLKKIDYISCREYEATKVVNDLTDKEVTTVLDPTLLLEKEEWEPVEQEYNNVPSEYILLYLVSPKKEYFNMAVQISKKLKMPILYISYSPRKIISSNIKTLYDVTPGQFLSLIRNSNCVITNSFHGTVISTTYEKNFFVIKDTKKANSNQRIERILKIFGFEDRFIKDSNDITTDSLDYSTGKSRMKIERQKSEEFLKKVGN